MQRLFPSLGQTPKPRTSESQWFWDHYEDASAQVVNFCEAAGLKLAGLDIDIADIGCGDGIMATGLLEKVRPRRLAGFDIVPTNVERLIERCREERVLEAMPEGLEFLESGATAIPASDAEFDFVYSWSAFEHISDPLAVLREIRRILKPEGHFFLQLWPFYRAAQGAHLWDWCDEDFRHLVTDEQELAAEIRASNRHPKEWTDYMLREFEKLNRLGVADLQRAVLDAGFEVRRVELLSNPVQLDRELAGYAWTDLAVGGVKLLAVPQ